MRLVKLSNLPHVKQMEFLSMHFSLALPWNLMQDLPSDPLRLAKLSLGIFSALLPVHRFYSKERKGLVVSTYKGLTAMEVEGHVWVIEGRFAQFQIPCSNTLSKEKDAEGLILRP